MISRRSEPLKRAQANALLAGVCSGFAEYLDVDPNLLRLGLVTFALFFSVVAVLGYGIAWGLMRT